MQALNKTELAAALAVLNPAWKAVGLSSITREFSSPDFKAAFAFATRVASLAEERRHHPEIRISYSRVTLTLSTHEANGVTEKDISFAETIG